MNDDGAVHVFEAVITGMLVITAILFMTALSKPESSEAGSGVDLARLADDTLQILQTRPADACVTCDNRLEEIVEAAVSGDESAHEFIQDVLPTGTRYLLRLDNGFAPLTLLPSGSGPTTQPRNAEAAEVFLAMDWNAHTGATIDDVLHPGQAFDKTGWTIVEGPMGGNQAPGGESWLSLWLAEPGVPAWAPYGVWEVNGGSTNVLVVPEGIANEPVYPVYGIQLVVWVGA